MSGGWNAEKVKIFEEEFYNFLNQITINSKDLGPIILGQHIYRAQRRFITAILRGLAEGKHDFKILKSRQLGLSTIARALTLFWVGIHDGLKGYMVFDTDAHKEEARIELIDMLKGLDPTYKFPRLPRENRNLMKLTNGSMVNFATAGVRASKSSGVLGRSSGVNFCHNSEMCSWDNEDGLESFKNSLSEIFPDRLYIWESTARGFNQWWRMWLEAKEDSDHVVTIFLGWWAKDSQQIARTDKDFVRYGLPPPTEAELEKIRAVKVQYDWDITPEQLAWVRRKMDPTAKPDGDAPVEFEGDSLKLQEQPWTEDDAFLSSQATFFENASLTEQVKSHVSTKFKAYTYFTGIEFADMRIFPAENQRSVQLKIWEEPVSDSQYIVGVDPAFGASEDNDRSAIQVFRCYADGLDQVAEYAWPLVNTRQLAWIVASLLGWYGAAEGASLNLILELNGPGEAVWNELMSLRLQLKYAAPRAQEPGLQNIFQNVKNYIYWRSDSMAPGHNYHWKCLAVDTPLPTPSGWTTMGDLRNGDVLYDDRGQFCRVVGTSPVHENHDCYRVTFDDGCSIVADAEHLWPTTDGLTTTCNLFGKAIEFAEPLDASPAMLPVAPYALGAWLGDGETAGSRIYAHADDAEAIFAGISGFTLGPIVTDPRGKTVSRGVQGLATALRAMGVLGNKHIPAAYLRAGVAQRWALLQGLMDTDGSISADRQCTFTTTSPLLADGFAELLHSLGIKAKSALRSRKIAYAGGVSVCQDAEQFWFTAYPGMPVFRLPRKAEQIVMVPGDGRGAPGKPRFARSRRHSVVGVQEVESVPVRCIEVDSPSHLFLAGKSMVPTHNTTERLKITIMERLRDFIANGAIRMRSIDTMHEMRAISREGDTIKAERGGKDDRVLATAFVIRCWEERVRRTMMAGRRTREFENNKSRLTVKDQVVLFNQNQLESFFKAQSAVRAQQTRTLNRSAWRHRR